jgi:hypothetical protein
VTVQVEGDVVGADDDPVVRAAVEVVLRTVLWVMVWPQLSTAPEAALADTGTARRVGRVR